MANTEHIYQFAVSIDEDAIVRRMSDNLEGEMKRELKEKVNKHLFDGWSGQFTWAMKDLLTSWLDDHKEEIIKEAGECLAAKLVRTKAGKEILMEVKNDLGGNSKEA